MASQLPFNQISVGGSVLAGPDAFVAGSGSYKEAGEDNSVTTADARMHHYRSAITKEASAELKGDQTANETGYPGTSAPWPALPAAIKLQLVATRGGEAVDIATFDGIIDAEYDSKTNVTKLTIKASGA